MDRKGCWRAAEQRDGELGARGPGGGKHSYMGNHRKEDRRGKRRREDDFRLPGGKSDVRKRMELRGGTEGHWEQISLGNSMRTDGKAAGKRGTEQRKGNGEKVRREAGLGVKRIRRGKPCKRLL